MMISMDQRVNDTQRNPPFASRHFAVVIALTITAGAMGCDPPQHRPAGVDPESSSVQEASPQAPTSTETDPAPADRDKRAKGDRSRCLDNPKLHAVGLASHLASADHPLDPDRIIEEELVDLDGDGTKEKLFIDEYSGSANQAHFLYLSNNGCWRSGGTIWLHAESMRVNEDKEKVGGLPTLTVFVSDGCAGRAGTVEELAWSGLSYEKSNSVTCLCPDDHPSAVRPPACP